MNVTDTLIYRDACSIEPKYSLSILAARIRRRLTKIRPSSPERWTCLNVIQITTPLDTAFISTRAGFIDYCADQEFLRNELLPVLIPMQMGDTEPSEVELIPENEMNSMDEEGWDSPVF